MTVADIITAARQFTQITGSTWFTPADELRSVNRAYRDIYEKIIDSDDEYFIKEVEVAATSLTPITTKIHTYEYTLPDDWYRLRQLRIKVPNGEAQLSRLDVNAIYQAEGYSYFNDKLRITYINDYQNFRIEYYPKPVEYTLTTEDIVYPPQLEPLIVAYRMAMDIEKAQKGDPSRWESEYLQLWNRFAHATARRDDLHHVRVANVYRSTPYGW